MKKTALLVLLVLALPAAAHPGHAGGLLGGVLHPWTGADHLLAMLGVGIWSRQRQQPALMSAFLLAMGAGASLQAQWPQLDTAIAATLVLTGALLAAPLRLPRGAAMAMVALFALLHGQAHSSELPGAVSAAGYLLGSAALLASGYALKWPRLAGAALGSAGLCLLAGVA